MSASALAVGLWQLVECSVINQAHSVPPFVQAFPIFSLGMFPWMILLSAIVGWCIDQSIMGGFVVLLNMVAAVKAFSTLALVRELIRS